MEGASDAARSAADIVFLAPGLSAIIDALKTSRQIFHRMYAYVVYRIALSLHLEIFLGLWIVILNTSLNLELVVFIAIFAVRVLFEFPSPWDTSLTDLAGHCDTRYRL